MGATGQRLGLRLFLEGLEVPVVSAQVQCNINAPATASIQVVPGEGVLALKARTMVHLFFWDYTMDRAISSKDPVLVAELYGVTVDEAKLLIEWESGIPSGDVEDLKGYRLLFCGELMGVVFNKTPLGRQAVLQCSDFSTYWDTTYQFFVSFAGWSFLGSSAGVWAGASNMFNDILSGHVSVMNKYLQDTPKTPGMRDIKGLMGGLISLLEAMGGVPKHTHGVNDFFTIGELKNHILQQITAEQNDDTAQKLFDNKAFWDWLSKGFTSMGQLVTFRDMMKLLFKYVYYETVPNPCAMYVPRKHTKTKIERVKVSTYSEEAVKYILEIGLEANHYAELSYGGKSNRSDEFVLGAEFRGKIDKGMEMQIPKQAKTFLQLAKDKTANLRNTNPNVTTSDEIKPISTDTGKGVPLAVSYRNVPKQAIPSSFVENRKIWGAIARLISSSLNDAPKSAMRDRLKTLQKAEIDFLHTQIFRPDCFFAPPPKCNVIFPDQYTQFNFSRNFLQECTRLRLSTDMHWGINKGAGGLMGQYHFAPSTQQIKEVAKEQKSSGVRALLPWEIYSGILPKFETMHEVNYSAGRAERKHGYNTKNIVGPAHSYAQRTANFNYMKYRFASRSCEVSMKFNPFIVCGFPMLVIDKPWILDEGQAAEILNNLNNLNDDRNQDMSEFIREAAYVFRAPTQFLGMVAAMSHSVNQEGGGTSVTLTHARTHRVTDDDFLVQYSYDISSEMTKEIVSTVLDAEDLLKKGDYKKLQFLKMATPQNLHEQATSEIARQSLSEQTTPDDVDTEERPGSSKTFAPLVNAVIPPPKISTYNLFGDGKGYDIVGATSKAVRVGSSGRIVEIPDPPGELTARKGKGPKGGDVVQVEVASNKAIAVIGSRIGKKALKSIKSKNQVGPKRLILNEGGRAYINPDVGPKRLILNDGGRAYINPDESAFREWKKKPDQYVRILIAGDVVSQFTIDKVSSQITLNGVPVDNGDVVYYWKNAIIYEEVKKLVRLKKLLPVEEGIRPPWFSPLYSNWKIGDGIYQPFFGCGSIVDESLFISPVGKAVVNTSRKNQQAVLDKLNSASGDPVKMRQIIEEAGAANPSDVPDIEASVDTLAYLYGEVRRHNLDVNQFVQDYTWRPIASMEDIFGTADLKYEDVGGILNVVSGEPGFHSSAIANFGDLLGLIDNPDDLELPRLDKGTSKKEPLDKSLDPRPGRRKQVELYLTEIHAASGGLGVGIQG